MAVSGFAGRVGIERNLDRDHPLMLLDWARSALRPSSTDIATVSPLGKGDQLAGVRP